MVKKKKEYGKKKVQIENLRRKSPPLSPTHPVKGALCHFQGRLCGCRMQIAPGLAFQTFSCVLGSYLHQPAHRMQLLYGDHNLFNC